MTTSLLSTSAKSVAPVELNAVIPEVIIFTASKALPERANR
jgi:hypothetical protein